MRSNGAPDLDGFLDGFVTTPEDVAALDRVRSLNYLEPVEYLRFLLAFADLHPPTREIPPRHEPFVL
jgi:hypothetical protein